MAVFLAPVLNDQQVDANGAPLSGGLVEVYLAGTSTPSTTYSDKAGLVPNTWPIVLNTLGVNNQGEVWLTGGAAYKLVIKNSVGVVQRTLDNVSGIGDATSAVDQWIVFQGVPTYVSSTSFTVVGDQTQIFQIGRRVKTTNTGGTIYGTITNSVYGSPNTTVTVVNDSGTLDSGLSSVSYGIISVLDTSLPSGRLLTVTRFIRVAGVINASINGGVNAPSSTWTRQLATKFAIIKVQGGGGGGGGSTNPAAGNVSMGSPGACGGYGESLFTTATLGVLQAIVVGTGGVGGTAGVNGSGGVTSSFGALLTAGGGGGGTAGAAAVPPLVNGIFSASGTIVGANLVASTGTPGCPSVGMSTNPTGCYGGAGGGTLFGPPTAVGGANANGVNAVPWGGGGGGTVSTPGAGGYAGGNGADGVVFIYEYA